MQGHPSASSGLSGLSWDDVRFFLALSRARTLREAGEELGVDTSTVSRRLTTLEAVVGAPLFQRGREGIRATSVAESLEEAAQDAESAVRRFSHAAGGVERDVSGVVRFACPPGISEVFLAPALPTLFAAHPGLSLTIAAGVGVVDLTRREADLAVRTMRPSRGDLLVKRLTTTPWQLMGERGLVKKLKPLASLRDVPFVGFGEGLASLHVAQWLAKHGRESAVRLRSDSFAVQLAAARAGVGLIVAPAPYAKRCDLDIVKTLPPLQASTSALPTDELFLVTHQALRDLPKIKTLWSWALGLFAERGELAPPREGGKRR